MRRIGSEHYDDIHMVEFAKEMTGHGAFYGSALATVLGYQKESYLAYGIATMWFAFCTFSAYSLVMRIKELEQRKGDGSKVNREENFNV